MPKALLVVMVSLKLWTFVEIASLVFNLFSLYLCVSVLFACSLVYLFHCTCAGTISGCRRYCYCVVIFTVIYERYDPVG